MSSRKFAASPEEKRLIAKRMNDLCEERGYKDLVSFVNEKYKNHDLGKVLSDWNLGKSINYGFIIWFADKIEGVLDFILAGIEPIHFRKPKEK